MDQNQSVLYPVIDCNSPVLHLHARVAGILILVKESHVKILMA